MEQPGKYWKAAKESFNNAEERFDQWVLRNPVSFWRRMKFRSIQKQFKLYKFKESMEQKNVIIYNFVVLIEWWTVHL